MPKGKNLLEKTCHCYYQTTETNACVCECKIVEEESEMRTKNPYLHTTMQKNNRFKIYEMKKKTRQIIVQCLPLQLLLVL